MNISLPPELEQFVAQELRGGIYHSADDVVCAALLRLKHDQQVKLPELPDTLEELEAQLASDLAEIENGQVVDAEPSLQAFRQRIRDARISG